MSLNVGSDWSYQDLRFHGLSLSGIRTTLALPELHLAFDVAQGFPFLFPIKKFFLTHGHLDHAAGIPYIISQKNLLRMPMAEYYMPPSLVEPLTEIMRLWEKIEDHHYSFQFIGVNQNEIPVNPHHFIRAFPTYHRIESFGYTLFKRNKRLHSALAGASKAEVIEAKKRGDKIDEFYDTPLVSFTGDTKIEFLDGPSWIRTSKVLFLESTYLDDKKTIQQAREWGHTHLDEIIPHLDSIKSEKIVLIHLSSRYTMDEALHIVRQKIPARHQDRVLIFPGR
jgi:ribonuclease Z